MADSIRQQILDALQVQLEAVPATVRVNEQRPTDASELPLLIMLDGDDERDEAAETTGAEIRSTTVTIEGYTRASTAAGLRPARENLLAQVRVALLADRTVGDRAIDLEIQSATIVADDEEGHPYATSFSQDVAIQYATAEDDPFAPGF